ncbi:MAG TPA: hypothetical protein VI298_08620 [Geobacteraceae bacterium]
MNFRRVTQPAGSLLCLAAVCAMVTGETVGHVQEFCGHDDAGRALRVLDAARYLNDRGWNLGGYVRGRWPVVANMLAILLRYRLGPAVVIVAARTGAGTHAVLWTSAEVFDPEPTNTGKRLRDYRILEWWPLIKIIEG